MASNYQLVSSQSSIQVLSPTVVQDVVVVTIQTIPHRVTASIWLTQREWDDGLAPATLEGFATNIETIMDSPKVVGASGGQSLDASGLLASEIVFTVGFQTPGSPFPPATIDVSVPATQLRPEDVAGHEPGVDAALSEIDHAYQQLAAAAGVVPADATG